MSWRDCVTWVTYMPSDLDVEAEMTRVDMLLADDGRNTRKSEEDQFASMTISAIHDEIVMPTTLRGAIAEQEPTHSVCRILLALFQMPCSNPSFGKGKRRTGSARCARKLAKFRARSSSGWTTASH